MQTILYYLLPLGVAFSIYWMFYLPGIQTLLIGVSCNINKTV